MKELKVYEFDSGEQEYIAAKNLNEAKRLYTEITGEDDFSDFEITEYPKEKWAKFIIDYPDDNPKWQETLERKMQRTSEPEYLCATVY